MWLYVFIGYTQEQLFLESCLEIWEKTAVKGKKKKRKKERARRWAVLTQCLPWCRLMESGEMVALLDTKFPLGSCCFQCCSSPFLRIDAAFMLNLRQTVVITGKKCKVRFTKGLLIIWEAGNLTGQSGRRSKLLGSGLLSTTFQHGLPNPVAGDVNGCFLSATFLHQSKMWQEIQTAAFHPQGFAVN